MTAVATRPGLDQIKAAPLWAKIFVLGLGLFLVVAVVFKATHHESVALTPSQVATKVAGEVCHFPAAAVNGSITEATVTESTWLQFIPYLTPTGQHEAQVLMSEGGDHGEVRTCG